MAILLSKYRRKTFEDFLQRFISHVETRILTDFEISAYSKTYRGFKKLYRDVVKRGVNQQKFIDYCFEVSDGIPFPERMMYLLRNYRERPGSFRLDTIYDVVERDIIFVKDKLHEADNVFLFYEHNKINPFIVIFDPDVQLSMWRRWLPMNEYWESVYVASVLINRFKKMQRFIIKRLEI